MSHFPFFIDLQDRPGLIIGGGAVALGKARRLLPFGPRLTVVSPELSPELETLPGLRLLRRSFLVSDMEGMAFVIAASSDRALNHLAARACRERGIPVNTADCPKECTFFFPALVKRGPLCVGITSGGASPSAAVWVKEQVSALLPEGFADILTGLQAQRSKLKAALPEPERAGAFKALFRRSLAKGRSLTEAEVRACLAELRETPGEASGPRPPAGPSPMPPAVQTGLLPPGSVALVGAGCGGPELLTLRGAALLAQCDAVVCDELADPRLLDLAPASAERVLMGKRAGRPSAAQEDIIAALIRLAREKKRVVRLKGGDPFLFGRGGEELAALREAGIPCEMVPGVSSALAVPAAAGIPVTHRGLSQAVHIITGHTAGGGLPEPFAPLAALEGTLVFLMGLGHLGEICRRLIEGGKAPGTPAAVVTGDGRAVRGTLEALPELAAGVRPPAVIVAGETAALELTGTVARPLDGLRVGLVGTPVIREKLSAGLGALGAQVFTALALDVVPLPLDLSELFCELAQGSKPWLAFTSGNGVERFFHLLAEQGLDIRRLAGCGIAAVGTATGAALRERGIRPDLLPEPQTTAGLRQALLSRAEPGQEVVLFRSAQANAELREALARKGLRVRDLRLYDVRSRGGGAGAEGATHLVFASAGGVRAYLEAFGALPEGAVPVSIGPVTAAELERATGRECLMAAEPSAEALVRTIVEAVGNTEGN